MSERYRWSKFWWQDWQRDPCLRSCSLAARGLWMDLLCLAFDGDPVGHVTINGKPATSRQIASIAGTTEREAAKLLAELRENGVFSETSDGVIYSRRMVRDKAASDVGKAYGKSGGNPKLTGEVKGDAPEKSQHGITGGVNPPPTPKKQKQKQKQRQIRTRLRLVARAGEAPGCRMTGSQRRRIVRLRSGSGLSLIGWRRVSRTTGGRRLAQRGAGPIGRQFGGHGADAR